MGGINSAIHSSRQSLSAYSAALAVVQENIANASTVGYARQRVSLASIVVPGAATPQGVEIQRVEALRSELLDKQVVLGTQRLAGVEKKAEFFSLIEPTFRIDGDSALSDSIDGFFAAAQALSVSPADLNLRRAFQSAGSRFAASARSSYQDLVSRQADLDTEARTVVSRVNTLADQIAQLSTQRSADPKASNSAVDTRLQQVLEELGGLIDVSTQRQNDGTLAVISGGTPLVVGDRVRPISVSVSNQGLQVLDSSGKDITANLQDNGGRLGGLLEARNRILPELLGDVNRLVKGVADRVNEQLAQGVDLTGAPGAPLFQYDSTFLDGSGRTAGLTGAATPAAPGVQVDFTGGVTGTITATLDSFLVGAAPPSATQAGDRITLELTSADGSIDVALETAALVGGETVAEIAQRLNDRIALSPELAGLVEFSDAGGSLKATLSEQAGQGFELAVSTNRAGFTTGLEAGGSLGGQSAEEIAAALNEQVALNSDLAAAGVRFAAVGGELRVDADQALAFDVTDLDPSATGFASGLAGVNQQAGGALAAATLTANIALSRIAAGEAGNPNGGGNIVAVAELASGRFIEGRSFSEYYAGIVNDLGSAADNVNFQVETQRELLTASQNLRDSLSAVDINEEAVQLLQFEQGYSALLRVMQTLGQLTDEVLSLIR